MSDAFVPRVGGIPSADIAVPDHAAEVRFYARVLTTGDDPVWREDLMNRDGVPVIGLGERTAEFESLPLQWMPHIQVADVATSVQRALELGGQELMHGKAADGTSLWAGLLDPNGAAFGIIPVMTPDQIPKPEGEPTEGAGRIAWLDLTIDDASATRDFYQQVVGWSVEDVEMQSGDEGYADYTMCAEDGGAAAGVCHARGVNLGLPPVWMLYLPVGDLAESLQRVRDEGGQVIKEAGKPGDANAYAVIQDPVGVSLALVQG